MSVMPLAAESLASMASGTHGFCVPKLCHWNAWLLCLVPTFAWVHGQLSPWRLGRSPWRPWRPLARRPGMGQVRLSYQD